MDQLKNQFLVVFKTLDSNSLIVSMVMSFHIDYYQCLNVLSYPQEESDCSFFTLFKLRSKSLIPDFVELLLKTVLIMCFIAITIECYPTEQL